MDNVDEMQEKKPGANKHIKVAIMGLVVLLGIIGFGAFKYTSQISFCASCHEMDTAFAGWKVSVHQEEHCYECHTDQGFVNLVKVKANGLKELYIHFTREVNMDEVESVVPASRCAKCHDMTNSAKLGERVAAFHVSHAKLNFDCVICHKTAGHTGDTFNGFKNEACQKCHSTSI